MGSQSKAQAQYLIDVLEDFKADPEAVDWVRLHLRGSSCIGSIDDAIAATRAGLDILTSSEADFIVFLNTFTELKDMKELTDMLVALAVGNSVASSKPGVREIVVRAD